MNQTTLAAYLDEMQKIAQSIRGVPSAGVIGPSARIPSVGASSVVETPSPMGVPKAPGAPLPAKPAGTSINIGLAKPNPRRVTPVNPPVKSFSPNAMAAPKLPPPPVMR